ncbi:MULTISPECIES: hypothetical protein [Pseudoalteromonas]|uniref:hypothetical protein n=1 Tax=Pseudoalteromonas TaxID=53246 RepID=UPI00068F5888|nr:hypothetical protein [Pseudoalteromonas flavipulchra]MBD0783602.1 hypothetical protein [Pseudoalteromonas flavipulchra]MBE0375078.1 hypothetical protein [Pseudoalteromonas flavipulchra NCIMB 2033 = ATCC BAA-314]
MNNKLELDKKVIFYIDDVERHIERFRSTCESWWNSSEFIVKSNSIFGAITDKNKSEFIRSTIQEMEKYSDSLACVLLDLDYSGDETDGLDDNNEIKSQRDLRVGMDIGRIIRKKWPLLPIFIASHFSEEKTVISQGLMYDFDYFEIPTFYSDMKDESTFIGYLKRSQDKREAILLNLPNIPVSYLSNTHQYFQKAKASIPYEELVFVAMPFNETIVKADIYKSISTATDFLSLQAYRVDEDIFTDGIMKNIVSHIYEARIVIADITGMNPNVMFELGLAMSSNKDCVIIQNRADKNDIPFDLKDIPIIRYNENEVFEFIDQLKRRLRSLL